VVAVFIDGGIVIKIEEDCVPMRKGEVHRTFEACGSSKGGIVACGEVGPDVPLENIRAMYEAFREYGKYA
jgi:hypothetical protein